LLCRSIGSKFVCRNPRGVERRNHDRQGFYLPEVLFEFRPIGRFVRVIAIDPIASIEVTMVGDVTYGEELLKRIATRKLKYVIA